MAINPRLLNEGERVVVTTRTHVKALVVPVLVLLLLSFVTAFLAAQVSNEIGNDTVRSVLWLVLAGVALLAFVAWVLKPFLTWFSTSYTFTDRRFIQRTGIIAKEGRTIPLNRISGVDVEIGLADRLLGCGTLVVSDASEHGRVPIHDIPRVEQVQKQVAAELHALGRTAGAAPHRAGNTDDGT